MKNLVKSIERILSEQKDLYGKVFSIEEKKNIAIIEKDGKLIEKLSSEQENLLSRISRLERSREKVIKNYREMKIIENMPEDITLKGIAKSLNRDSSSNLLKMGSELKGIILKLSSLQETNRKLLNDNMEFYNILFSGLKSSTSIQSGYGKDGKEDGRVANSVMINKTV